MSKEDKQNAVNNLANPKTSSQVTVNALCKSDKVAVFCTFYGLLMIFYQIGGSRKVDNELEINFFLFL